MIVGKGSLLTVTVQDAVLLPSAVVTVIVAVPTAFAVIVPLLTVATLVALLLQVTFLFVALDGVMVAVNVSVAPTNRLVEVLLRLTPVTGTVTVTAQVAVLLPSAVVTVIVAVPDATAVTFPEVETVATLVLLLLQVTFLFVALLGATVAVSVSVAFGANVSVVLFRLTPVTGTVTVTEHVAVLLPSAVVTVIVAVPAAMAVTKPDVETVATDVLLLFQVTFLFVALEGETVAVSVSVALGARVREVLFKLTPVTGMFTVTAQVADLLLAVAVIVAVPEPTDVTRPEEDTVATFVLEEAHVIL